MTKAELIALVENYHEMDEIIVLSPGEKELGLVGLDFEKINETGKIVIRTNWLKDIKPPMTELERLQAENEEMTALLKKKKPATKKTAKRGRPKKTK